MVYDFRMYTLKPGGTPEYMAAVKELALPIRQKYGVKLAGWYYSDVGELNQVVHIWAYRDYAHMAEAKAQVAADPDWNGVKLAGWYYSDVGELNQVVHIWAYRDYAHMAEAKAQVAADPDWSGKYGPRVRPLIMAQKTYVMLSPDFAPQPQ